MTDLNRLSSKEKVGEKVFFDFLQYTSLFWPSYVPITLECNIYYWVAFEKNSFISILLMFDFPPYTFMIFYLYLIKTDILLSRATQVKYWHALPQL